MDEKDVFELSLEVREIEDIINDAIINCSNLIINISKWIYGDSRPKEIISNIVDVEISINILKSFYDKHDLIYDKNFKRKINLLISEIESMKNSMKWCDEISCIQEIFKND